MAESGDKILVRSVYFPRGKTLKVLKEGVGCREDSYSKHEGLVSGGG